MNAVEIIALIFAIIVLIKIPLLFIVDTKKMMKLAKAMFKKPVYMSLVFVVFLGVIGYFLLQQMTIVQITAAALFGMILYGMILIQFPEFMKYAEKILKNMKRSWFPILLMLILAIWVLIELFV
jgi:hypothetical protein